jgi:hypothetical protein
MDHGPSPMLDRANGPFGILALKLPIGQERDEEQDAGSMFCLIDSEFVKLDLGS